MNCRFCEQHDLPGVIELEKIANSRPDPDFGTPVVNPWALDEASLMEVVRQKNGGHGSGDTLYPSRVAVVEDEIYLDEDSSEVVVVGAFAYELANASYQLCWQAVHPDADASEVVVEIFSFLKKKADRSKTRKEVVVYLRDRDEADLRRLMTAWLSCGFSKPTLCRGLYEEDGHDGWRLSWMSEVYEPGEPEEASA